MLLCNKAQVDEILRQKECKKLVKEQAAKVTQLGRPVVLSQKRYNLLKSNADKPQREHDADKEAREKSKQKAEAMTSNFTGNVPRTPEQKLAEIKQNLEEKATRARASLDVSQAFHEGIRREKVAKAELLIEKLKCGPRELRSAAIQSEMFRARDVQLEVNAIINESYKQQELADKAACKEQFSAFIGEDQERMKERLEREKVFRTEMYDVIQEHNRVRTESKRKQIEEEKMERAKIDDEIKAQIQRERENIEKKRELLRKNAVEAMKMAEERKKRQVMTDEVEDRLCCVYNAGRHELEKRKNDQTKRLAQERRDYIDKNTEMLERIKNQIQDKEAERINRDINIMKLKFDAQEEEKRRREREAKKQRIEAHLKEMEVARQAKERDAEIRRYEIAQRFKNQEVNSRFAYGDCMEQWRRAKCVGIQLLEQEKERLRIIRERQAQVKICDNKRNEEEDNFFFKFAYTLMEDAKKKNRPLYPFKKAINEYKRCNMRELEAAKLPRHMVSNVCVAYHRKMGAKNGKASEEEETKSVKSCKQNIKKVEKISRVKAETLENMAKIDALFAEEEHLRTEKRAPYCVPYNCQSTVGNKNSMQAFDAETASEKIRCGMEELKNPSTPAPPVH